MKLIDRQWHVIPAKAGIQVEWRGFLDARLRGHDGLRYIKIIVTNY